MNIPLEANLMRSALNGLYFSNVAGIGLGNIIQEMANSESAAMSGLSGDVSAGGVGIVPATVNFVGGSSAANIHLAELLANAATALATAGTIVKRDGAGAIAASNFSGSSSGTNTGNVTLTAVGSAPSANAASLSGQALTLQPFDATHPGVVPASGGGTTNFLRADGTFAPAGATFQILVFTSSTSVSGAASEAVTFPGLLATDTILAVSQVTPGASNLPLLGFSSLADNTLTLTWVADPSTGYVVIVTVKR